MVVNRMLSMHNISTLYNTEMMGDDQIFFFFHSRMFAHAFLDCSKLLGDIYMYVLFFLLCCCNICIACLQANKWLFVSLIDNYHCVYNDVSNSKMFWMMILVWINNTLEFVLSKTIIIYDISIENPSGSALSPITISLIDIW
jgi:hypothetical protein